MGIKKFPQDYTDITATATKTMSANPDNSNGYVVLPYTMVSGLATFNNSINVNGVIKTNNNIVIDGNAAAYKQIQLKTNNILRWNIFSDDTAESGGNAGSNLSIARYSDIGNYAGEAIGVNRATGNLTFGGSGAFTGAVSGTVFNPTSLRDRKRDITSFKGNALAQINALKFHTYRFREYENIVKIPATEDTPAVMEQKEIAPTVEMLNVGVIIDEVDDSLIADQERGVLNLNNIVFLLAKSVQQLSARIEALESK